MKEIEIFKSTFDAVVFCNSSEFIFDLKTCGLPDFVTVEDFGQIHFYREAKINVLKLSERLHKKIDLTERSIEIEDFNSVVRVSIAECIALFFQKHCNINEINYDDYFNLLKKKVFNKVESKKIKLIHHFLADSSAFIGDISFKVGPVTLSGFSYWMRSNKFEKDWYNKLLMTEIDSLSKSNINSNDLEPGIDKFIEKFKDARTVVSVEISDRGGRISRRIALAVAQVALDSISLLLGEAKGFYQNILKEDFSYNSDYLSIVSHDGFLYVSEYGLTKTFPIFAPDKYFHFISGNENFKESIEFVLNDLILDRNGQLKKISHRWVSALNWFAQGCREVDDSIAITKLATSLDVLANSGKSSGTLNVISHVLGLNVSDIFDFKNNLTLERYFLDFYSDGRSKFVHGEFADRFERYEGIRNKAFLLARLVLIKSLFLMKKYEGIDHDKGFKFL